MGADLIGVSYVRTHMDRLPTSEEAQEVLERVIFGMPEETVELILDHCGLYDESEPGGDPAKDLISYAHGGVEDYLLAMSGLHRHHAIVGAGDDYYIYFAGGTSGGDDPYDGWSAFLVLLELAGRSETVSDALHLDPNIDDYLRKTAKVGR